ncbi:hypothetical protein Trydic_g21153 [Trypoxylus dichotomus]
MWTWATRRRETSEGVTRKRETLLKTLDDASTAYNHMTAFNLVSHQSVLEAWLLRTASSNEWRDLRREEPHSNRIELPIVKGVQEHCPLVSGT